MATDKLINQTQGDDIINALDDIATNLGNISYGEQTSSDKVVAMTGYEKASTAESISQADTLNEAIGKLEKKIDDSSVDDKVDGPDSATIGNIAVFDNVDGKSIDDSGISVKTSLDNSKDTEVPTSKAIDTYITNQGFAKGVSTSTANNLVAFNTTDGKTLKDSGVGIATSSAGIGDSDTAVPTSKAVKNYVDATISGTGRYLGTATAVTDLSTSAKEGDYYVVSTAWTGVHVCDVIIAKKDNPSQSIDDTNWSLLHNESNTDANVEQSPVSTNAEYEVLFSHSANNTSETSGVGKDDGITYNPSTNNLTLAGTMSAAGFTGTGVDTATSGSSASGSDTKVPSTKKLNEELGSVVKSVKLTSSDANPITPTNNVLTIPAFVGSGTGHKAGLVPDTDSSTAGTTKYLREDGTWNEPPLFGSSKLDTVRVLNQPDTWESKSWTGLTSSSGLYIWTDGENIYYSNGSSSNQYVLNKSTSTWEPKTWSGLTSVYGDYIWTDGENIYYSAGSSQKVLNKSTSTWSNKSWTGLTSSDGRYYWTDGDNIYYSNGSNQYVLNKSTSTWSNKSWTGLTSFDGRRTWTDGENIYYSSGSDQYVLNKTTSTWTAKTWVGETVINRQNIWTDGDNIYYSSTTDQKVLNKSTSTWFTKTWNGLTNFYGATIWTDGENIYYSSASDQYVLKKPIKTTKIPNVLTNAELTAAIGNIDAVLEAVL